MAEAVPALEVRKTVTVLFSDVMAVFSIPTVHEDDALRACRAAIEIQDTIDRLNGELERD